MEQELPFPVLLSSLPISTFTPSTTESQLITLHFFPSGHSKSIGFFFGPHNGVRPEVKLWSVLSFISYMDELVLFNTETEEFRSQER